MEFWDPQALSSTLATLEMLQPRAFRSQNPIETLDSVYNYYEAVFDVRVFKETQLSYVQVVL